MFFGSTHNEKNKQEDFTQKVVGSNPGAGKNFFSRMSLLNGSRINLPRKISFKLFASTVKTLEINLSYSVLYTLEKG